MRPADMETPGRCSGPGVGAIHEQTWPANRNRRAGESQRLPAYGRRLRDAIRGGLRPHRLDGGVLVTSRWDYARGAAPARLVCPPEDGAVGYDFGWLAGIEVLVMVPPADELHGEALVVALRDAGAALVVLAINREDEE